MGIPYLSRHLASFSEPVFLGNSPDSSCEAVRSIVIDGPGFVYHVHSILLSQASINASQIERQPSCDEVSVAVMTYLVLLQISGVNISKIYFDGALPLHKREIRISRLENSRKQLEAFCIGRRRGLRKCSPESHFPKTHPSRLLQGHVSPVKRAQLPGNPFMVSAVTEDLKSRWTSSEMIKYLPEYLENIYEENSNNPWLEITEIVPGEADMFCAAFAAQNPGTAILTSDSDLFLFDIGPHSSVIFFDSIKAENLDNDNDQIQSMIIKAMQFSSASISDRLGIPVLSFLAHEMKLSPRSKFTELVRRAKNASRLSQKTPAYLSFLEEYDLTNFKYDPSDASLLQGFDTRVSELIAQCIWSDKFQNQAPRIYLPFLLEDHSRRCAWVEGAQIRRLGYSLINLNRFTTSKYTTVNECVRRGSRFCFDEVILYTDEEIEMESTRLLDGFEFIQNKYSHLKKTNDNRFPLFWWTYALFWIHPDWFTASDVLSTPADDILRIFLGIGESNDDIIDWNDLHALAQVQSVLYSLRIVFQIIRDLLPKYVDGPVKQLQGYLSRLPPLRLLMKSYYEVRREIQA